MTAMKQISDWPAEVLAAFRRGVVIPAHPLLLTAKRELNEPYQRAVTRYYADSGAGGIAVGVHTTQFAIREAGLYEPVLRLAAETMNDWCGDDKILIAGVTGRTEQAL